MTTGPPEGVASLPPPRVPGRVLAAARPSQLVREFHWLSSRLTRLWRVTHFTAAVRIMLQRRAPVVAVPLRAIPSVFRIRQWSSDLQCLEQIFVQEEYLVPFDLKPKIIVDAGANIA